LAVRQPPLVEVARTLRKACFGFGQREGGEEKTRQNANDGNHDQQFDQRESQAGR